MVYGSAGNSYKTENFLALGDAGAAILNFN